MKITTNKYAIVPIHHAAPGAYVRGEYVRTGFVVTRNGCNIMPAATWFRTQSDADQAIRVFEHVKEDAKRFWRLLHRVNGVTQRGRSESSVLMAKLGFSVKRVDARQNTRVWEAA